MFFFFFFDGKKAKFHLTEEEQRKKSAHIHAVYPEAKTIDLHIDQMSTDNETENLCTFHFDVDDTLAFEDPEEFLTLASAYKDSTFIDFYMKLYRDGTHVVFINPPSLNTENIIHSIELTGAAADELTVHDMAAFQYQMYCEARENYKKGRKAVLYLSNKPNKQIGRKKGTTRKQPRRIEAEKIIIEQSKDFNGSKSDKMLLQEIDIGRNTFYKIKRDLKKQSM